MLPDRPRPSLERPYRRRHRAAQRVMAWYCREQRRGPGFRMPPEHGRWVLDAAVEGLRPVEDSGIGAARRLIAWALRKPGRADGRRTRLRVVYALLLLHRRGRLIAAGGQQLATLSGHRRCRGGGRPLSRATVVRVLQEARADGALWLVRKGVSAKITGDHDEVSVYAIVEPNGLDHAGRTALSGLRKRAGEPVVGHHPVGVYPHVDPRGAHGLELGRKTRRRPRVRSGNPGVRPVRQQRPELFAPRTMTERNAAVMWLVGWLGWTLSPQQINDIRGYLGPFFAAGWTPQAVTIAAHRYPDGRVHRTPLQDTYGVRDRGRVLGARLREWVVDGGPLPPPAVPAPVRRGPQPAWLRAEQAAPAAAGGCPPQERGPAADADVAALRARLRARPGCPAKLWRRR